VTGAPDWKGLLWETRGYLGLDEDDPVLRDELVEQAQANGWGEREIQDAIRSTDALELVGDLDDPRVQLADRDEQSDIVDVDDDQEADETPDTEPRTEERTSADSSYADAEFDAPESDAYPPELLEREQWMGHGAKKPFAPWADRDAPVACTKDTCTEHDPDDTTEDVIADCEDCQRHQNDDNLTCADCGHDARWKWGHTENYADGETIAMAEVDPRLDGRAFLQQPDDPFAYVDGDDVRDPETGEVHPAFIAILEHLGLTYADVSQSGAGAHAIFRGELPEGVKEASWQLDDEPWGSNDELPSIEMYPGKRVCVMTGEHVPGTPTEIREWNDDVLEPLLEANDDVATAQREDLSTDRDDYDLSDYEPAATSTDETTSDIRDVFAALDRLDARDVAERTIVHTWNDDASTSDGKRAFYPSWGKNSNGTANVVDDQIWQDTGDRGGYGGPVVMALIDAGELRPEQAAGGVRGEQWFQGVEHLQDLGFAIPEYDLEGKSHKHGHDVEQVPVFPTDDDLLTPTTGWDWRHAGKRESDTEDLVDQARDRTTETIADRIATGDRVLIEALPTLGKSYGAVKAAAQASEPVTIVTTRGNKEQYAQFEEWCEQFGLEYKRLPAFTRDCDTARGDHGAEWKETVMDWYRRGATGEEIHALAEQYHGQRLPCQQGGECGLAHAWDFDPEEYDVLIGHYTHAYKPKVTQGRTVLVDEFPEGAYEQLLDHGIEGAISYFLQEHDGLPFEDYADLIEHRHDEQRRADALAFLQKYGLDGDASAVLANPAGHAAAPAAVFTILAGATENLGNGWERVQFPDDRRVGLFDRETGEVSILTPPDLHYSSGVIGLDGTPTKRLWQLVLGERRLNHTQVLTDEERQEYIQNGLNLNLVRTTDKIKSYSPKKTEIEQRVSLEGDAALLEAIADQHGQQPALITTARAEAHYEKNGILDLVNGHKHYGDILGSNEFDDQRLGAVIGSRNFGPRYVSKWAGYLGETVDPTFPSPENDFTPTDYGPIGNQIRTHMREHETLQAAMRFGRDANGAVVYVHTDTLPDWIPLAGEGRIISTWSDGMRQVIEAAAECGSWRTGEIAAHPDVDIGQRRVFDILDDLRERGYVDREHEGRGYTWRDDGLHEVSDHGDVDLDPVDIDALDDAAVAELARTDNNTWKFRNYTKHSGKGHSPPSGETHLPEDRPANQGDPPPQDAG
jgi:hypothetical protein